MNEQLQAARVLDRLSDHMLIESIRETDPARREWVDGRLKYYVGRSEEILARAAMQKKLDREWSEHLKCKNRKRTTMVTRKLRGARR